MEEVFDDCQILLAVITAPGWQYLFKTHGIDGLLRINQQSGWFDDDEAKARNELRYYCLISGYDPDADDFGEYDETTGTFAPDAGPPRIIDWNS